MSQVTRRGSSGGGGSSPLTTKGDIYTFSTTDARLPIGSDGRTLIADSTASTGNKWDILGVDGGGTGINSYVPGDIIYCSSSNVLSKLSIGLLPGDVLAVNDSGVVEWDTDIIIIKDEFDFDLDQSATNSNGCWEASRSGTGDVTNGAGTSDHPGIVKLLVSANSDDALMVRGSNIIADGSWVVGGGVLQLNFLIKVDTLADVTDDLELFIGLGNATAFTASTDHIGIIYNRSSSTDWIPQTSNSSSTTNASGGSAVAVDTNWTHLQMTVNAAATSVSFKIDGVDAGSCITNIPSVAISPQIKLTKTNGSAERSVSIDAFRLYNKLTNSRWV